MKTTTETQEIIQSAYERGRIDGAIHTLDGLLEQLTSMRRNRLPMETILNDLAAAKQQLLAIKLAKSRIEVPEKGREPEEEEL